MLRPYRPNFLLCCKNIPQARQTCRLSTLLTTLAQIHISTLSYITRDLLNAKPFDGHYIPLLTAVAFFVLLLGIINYINIHTARLFTRAKEVGG